MVNAVKFPDMLSLTNSTNIVFDKIATELNLKYLLLSTKKALLGDPYFGVNLRNMLFEKNNIILRDLVIDDIFTNITIYMPQIRVERKDIEVISELTTLYVTIRAQNMIDFGFEDYSIKLLSVEEI